MIRVVNFLYFVSKSYKAFGKIIKDVYVNENQGHFMLHQPLQGSLSSPHSEVESIIRRQFALICLEKSQDGDSEHASSISGHDLAPARACFSVVLQSKFFDRMCRWARYCVHL